MPLSHPTLHLNLPARPAPAFGTEKYFSPPAHLLLNFDRLTEQMRSEPAPSFRRDPHAPDYDAALGDHSLQHNGFRIHNGWRDAFIHARRDAPPRDNRFAGDKLHLSVDREQVPQAFNAMASLLLSDDCPIEEWKVTDIHRVAAGSRVSEGTQFTLYIKLDKDSLQYTAQGLNSVRHFVQALEATLIEQQIRPGQRPDSDVYPVQWQYSSYRNEWRSEREGSEVQSRALQEEPFYRLIAQ
ncbi:phosphothreonine lyase [Pseudomonas sp. JAI115]|uniref:type III effector phosphothreonine lyase n=1 Tax=Pseudomonas sp. JAI115 TaxID=2723061 RepID=UPI0016123CA3|nr:type III effector phosphothreonine lyase [Pseudomonas sp. JAI115]MBB6155169.1 phosphothreonine lyase [Pseudomonas sp. JAI115]